MSPMARTPGAPETARTGTSLRPPLPPDDNEPGHDSGEYRDTPERQQGSGAHLPRLFFWSLGLFPFIPIWRRRIFEQFVQDQPVRGFPHLRHGRVLLYFCPFATTPPLFLFLLTGGPQPLLPVGQAEIADGSGPADALGPAVRAYPAHRFSTSAHFLHTPRVRDFHLRQMEHRPIYGHLAWHFRRCLPQCPIVARPARMALQSKQRQSHPRFGHFLLRSRLMLSPGSR